MLMRRLLRDFIRRENKMEDNLTDFQRKLRGVFNPFNLFLMVLEMGFLIFVGVIFANVLTEPNVVPEVGADEFVGQIEGLSWELSDDIGRAIYDAIAKNTGDGRNVDESGVIVRDGSLIDRRFDGADLRYVSFIVDVPELSQSYWVYYDDYGELDADELSGGAPEVVVACLVDDNEMIYKDFDCRDGGSGLARNYVVAEYLKYFRSDGFVAFVDPGDEEMKHIRVMSKKHEYTDEESERYVRETKEFIESLGISPELFEYTVEPAPLGESDEPVYVY